jgi:hypothetical protein
VSRIVVIGGRGWFGRAAVDLLRSDGARPLVAARRPGADLVLDAEEPASVRAALRAGDVVIDAAGPFQHRTTALVETCLTLGCDVIDISDSLRYAQRLLQLAAQIEKAGIRVLTSCSSVSTVSAALLRLSGVERPVRLSAILAPATRNTSTAAAGQSLLSTLGRSIHVRCGGALVERRAFSEERRFAFPPPVGSVRGRLSESPDGLLLPLVWPTLGDVDFWIDTRRVMLNALFAAAARHRPVLRVLEAMQAVGRRATKYLGAKAGGFAIDVEDASGRRAAAGFFHATHSYLVAVAPAVLAARAVEAGRFCSSGLVPPDQHVEPGELAEYLRRAGMETFGFDGESREIRT